ncbi:50S ribosomal protein L25 [uncultured Gimesia sp.]|uniref:50S ribosomal protein L25 n=1 Tax=uncultured Gimesia sp. TaxID=1678688 RepID=UPI00261B349A|nr:50S ribosomal protein L25 [uncultured Gimesia sp.]
MSDEFVLQRISGTKRDQLGSIASRRIRRAGQVPAVVYGHEQEPAHICVDNRALDNLIKNRERVFEIDVEGKVEETMLRELQWDTFGTQILHVDLVRINASERVTVEVPVKLRGTSPGVVSGGIMELALHSIELDCLAHNIPDNISVRINGLEIGDTIYVRDLEVPRGSKLHDAEDQIVVHVLAPKGEEEEEETPVVETPEVAE